MRLAATLTAALLSIAVPAVAAPPAAVRVDPDFAQPPSNAALLYSRTWLLEIDNSLRKVAEYNWADPNLAITPELTAALALNRSQVEGLLRAVAVTDCNWGIEYDLGFAGMLPHLSKLRASARLLAVEARVKSIQGDHAAAAERAAAIFHLARHSTGDQLVITTLVAQAIANLGTELTEILRPSLTSEGRAQILAAAQTLVATDPFGAKAGVRGEGMMIQKWLKANCTSKDAGKQFVALVLETVDSNEAVAREVQAKLGSADQATLHADLDKATRVTNDTLAVWDLPDAPERLAQIGQRVESGQYGAAALIISPSLAKYYESTQKATAKLQGLITALQPPVASPDKPGGV
jgi:hypothetical protein